MLTITEVQLQLVQSTKFSDKVLAYARIVVDNSLLVRDLRIVRGSTGPYVVFPSRKVCDRCPACEGKNPLDALHCNWCGVVLSEERLDCLQCSGSGDAADPVDECPQCNGRGTKRLYEDIAHPISKAARDYIQRMVLQAWREKTGHSNGAAETTDSHQCKDPECGFCRVGQEG
jgi:stage V sporulation protein G